MSIKLHITGPNLIEQALKSPFAQVESIETNEHFFDKLKLKKYQHQCSIRLIKERSSKTGRESIAATVYYSPLYQYEKSLVEKYKTILYLDHLSDPQNIGNALRHGLAFDVDAVILPQHKACPINETVARSSVGALFQIPIFYITGVGNFLGQLKKDGFGIIGTALEGAEKFEPNLFWPKTVIAIGNEGSGLRPSTIKTCDCLVKIEHNPKIQSLNAATTATLLCYERWKQGSV